jgi:hypothetical protein
MSSWSAFVVIVDYKILFRTLSSILQIFFSPKSSTKIDKEPCNVSLLNSKMEIRHYHGGLCCARKVI